MIKCNFYGAEEELHISFSKFIAKILLMHKKHLILAFRKKLWDSWPQGANSFEAACWNDVNPANPMSALRYGFIKCRRTNQLYNRDVYITKSAKASEVYSRSLHGDDHIDWQHAAFSWALHSCCDCWSLQAWRHPWPKHVGRNMGASDWRILHVHTCKSTCWTWSMKLKDEFGSSRLLSPTRGFARNWGSVKACELPSCPQRSRHGAKLVYLCKTRTLSWCQTWYHLAVANLRPTTGPWGSPWRDASGGPIEGMDSWTTVRRAFLGRLRCVLLHEQLLLSAEFHLTQQAETGSLRHRRTED